MRPLRWGCSHIQYALAPGSAEQFGHVGTRIYTIGNHLAGAGVLATRACSPQAQEKKEPYGDHGRETGVDAVHSTADVKELSVSPQFQVPAEANQLRAHWPDGERERRKTINSTVASIPIKGSTRINEPAMPLPLCVLCPNGRRWLLFGCHGQGALPLAAPLLPDLRMKQ